MQRENGYFCNFFVRIVYRYEQGFEDYEEAVARVEKTKEDRQRRSAADSFSQISAALQMFSVLSTAWNQVSNARSMVDEPQEHTLFNNGHDFVHNSTAMVVKHVLKRDMTGKIKILTQGMELLCLNGIIFQMIQVQMMLEKEDILKEIH